MELVLNLFWLLLALTALGHGVAHARARRFERPLACLILALSCTWLLLFPVISVTDDLHAAAEMAEGAGSARKLRSTAQHPNGFSGGAIVPAASRWPAPTLAHSGWIHDETVVRLGRAFAPSLAGRAPPTRAL